MSSCFSSPRKLHQGRSLRLAVLKLDGSSFEIEVAKSGTVGEVKKAVESAFRHLPNKVSWEHLWGQFCLCRDEEKTSIPLFFIQIGLLIEDTLGASRTCRGRGMEGDMISKLSDDRNKKPAKCGNKSIDMMSNLPDDLLVHILSFLPLTSAATTSLLSHRWLHLWKHAPNKLIFKCMSQTTEHKILFVNRVNSFIKAYKGDLREVTINFYATKSERCHVAKWLEFAISRGVERLDIDFRCRFIFDALPLRESLKNITIPSSVGNIIHSLKVLGMRQIKISADDIQFFLGNCPNLEQLVIEDANLDSDLEVVASSLKHLELTLFPRKHSIKVSAPNLTFLKIDHDTKKLFLENVPKLVNMVIDCRASYTIHDFATIASQLETLVISLDHPEASFSVPEMPKLKKLVVDDRFHIPYYGIIPFPITCFLRASPCLQEFEAEIIRLTLEEGVSQVPKVGPVFQHLSIKRFKLLWSCGGSPCDDRINLVRYIVSSCVSLEEIVISQCDGSTFLGHECYLVDDCVRVATREERLAFENIMQLQLPELIKLRIVNHSHLEFLPR